MMKAILDLNVMETIKGGDAITSFCEGFAAGEIVYGIGVFANLWNPVGWVGGVTMLAVDAGCLAYS
jgi:hypothetical protein